MPNRVVLRDLKSRIIVAADFDTLEPAVALAEKVGPYVFAIKVGSEFAEAVGAPQAVEGITNVGCPIFRDGKIRDIKNTVRKTAAAAVRPGVVMLNMFADNGEEKMRAAHEAVQVRAEELGIPVPMLLGVTILTDLDWDDLKAQGYFADQPSDLSEDSKKEQLRELVVKLAKQAKEAGLEGVIASSQEASLIRKACGPNFVIATPGIRPADAPPDDQKRTRTPREAVEEGADLLVIGRPITGADDPLAVVQQFNKDIAEALAAMQAVFARPSSRVRISLPPRHPDEVYLAALRDCGGYYNAPVDPQGTVLGPLVAYSGRYKVEGSDEERQWLGFRYFNLAMLEQYPHVAELFASGLAAVVQAAIPKLDCIVGVPDGGLIIGHNTARHLDVMYAGMQKKVVALATETSKEQTKLTLGRHNIEPGMLLGIGEDLTNNFSTTEKAIETAEATGGKVVAIICGLNRSQATEYNGLPVISLVHLPTPEYKQDDTMVAPWIEQPGVVWDVKPNWPQLKQTMDEAQARGIPIL